MNSDLPQFNAGNQVLGWSEISTAFDLAPLAFGLPVAVQVFNREGNRVLFTGIVTSTEDQFPNGSDDSTPPIRSTIFFQDADPVEITWNRVTAVIAMSALEEPPDSAKPEDLTE